MLNVHVWLSSLSRRGKRLLMVGADTLILPVALWGAFALRLGDLLPAVGHFWWVFVLVPLMSVPLFAALGFYRMIVRHIGPQALLVLAKGVTVSALFLAVVVMLFGFYGFPRSVLPLYWMIALLGVVGSRLLVRAYWLERNRRPGERKPVAIYGAGRAGAQLAEALRAGPVFEPVVMIDDDPGLHDGEVAGIRVYSPAALGELIADYAVDTVLLAIPNTSRARRRQILYALECHPVHVKTIPDLSDLAAGKARLDDLRDVDIEDLLGRDPVAPDPALMAACIDDKAVMVTGAGGSIGSELCRQIVQGRPRRLILYDINEYGLYRVDRELRALAETREVPVELIPLLGTVTDGERLRQIMHAYEIDTVYHAAAYKHVPIVEYNVVEGVRNNVLGTWRAAEAARCAGVRHFVLVSSDKAVRPTNVMGATKRFAEMILQALAERPSVTTFSMVRFGNVLGSSGSVVPLFREQIASGGPVTVTDPEVTRYFMTIPEAAALVIQAGALSRGGDVFVLDMGEPVRIVDLARRMIRLMGRTVREPASPNGDIAIRFTGLRPGEKLYEELLISDHVHGTRHAKIHRARESAPSWPHMAKLLVRLDQALSRCNAADVRDLLLEVVQGYTAASEVADLVWRQSRDTAVRIAGSADKGKIAIFPPQRRE